MKELFISDLDGTLLTPEGVISETSLRKLNTLLDEGVQFTIATARTASTALQIIEKLHLRLPVILMNGVVIYDTVHKKYVGKLSMTNAEKESVFSILKEHQTPAFIYAVKDEQLYCYAPNFLNEDMKEFRLDREKLYQKVFTDIESYDDLQEEEIIYFTIVGKELELREVANQIAKLEGISLLFYEDVYTDDWFLEVHVEGASKGLAALAIRDWAKADTLIVYGDNLNDLPMMEVADYAYATGNAKEEVKQAAVGVIGKNTEDSVANAIDGFLKNKNI